MDWILAVLLVVVGLLAGVLAALVWDGRAWQNLIRTSEQQRQRLQNRLNQTERQRHKLGQELAAVNQELTAVQNKHLQTSQEGALAQSRVQDLEAQLAGTLRQLTETQQLQQRLAAAEGRIREAEPIKSQLAARLAAAPHQLKFASKQGKKELEVIRGIGPTFARQLGDVGISELTQLAEETPERLLQILGLKPGNLSKAERWIEEAKALTNSLAAKGSDTAVPPPKSNMS